MLHQETIVSSRSDREIKKKIIKPGDYALVPYEDSRCKIAITDIHSTDESTDCPIESESRIFSPKFDGNILIGDSDSFIDRDIDLILQQMCEGEVCDATITYKDQEGKLAKELTFKIELIECMEEQLVSDWSVDRLYEASVHHKERGVELVKEKKMIDAFRRFSKAFKLIIAVEPLDPETVTEDRVKEMIDLKIKLYNNLAHCQLHFDQYEAVIDLCSRALKYDPDNVKSLYRRSVAYTGANLLEDAWTDIQKVLKLDPSDKLAQQKANALKPRIDKINENYTNVIKKMFV